MRDHGAAWRRANAGHASLGQLKVMSAIERCARRRSAAHVARCENRPAPTPSSPTTAAATGAAQVPGHCGPPWLAEREADLLPVPYFHVVYTLPAQIADIAYQNKAVIYDLLFKASAETTLTIAADPKHLGARIGFMSVLHTLEPRICTCALGHKACRDNRSVQYHRVPRLFEALALARGDGRYGRMLKTLNRVQLLILDDWGLSVLNPPERRDLLEILDDRHGRASTIVTSQIPVEHWHDIIGDPTLGDAILDRLVHNAHRLQLTGESMRKKNARNQTLDAASNP